MAIATEGDRATFLYDDCCPLCRTYTATFTALGWADRAPFSKVGTETLDVLDMDMARHYIPLVDTTAGTAEYGLDGILGVVDKNAPRLGTIARLRPVRWVLDRIYHFITYNRRHIVAAPPPTSGVDCAPDYEPRYVIAYLAFCGGVLVLIGSAAPLPVATVALAAATLTTRRDESWNIKPLEAVGHVGSTAVAATGAANLGLLITGRSAVAAALAVTVGARKIYLRRWMRRPKA